MKFGLMRYTVCLRVYILKTLSRFVWKGAVCVSNTSIHHVYILSMVILQITDVNDISGFVSVHVCVCVCVSTCHDPSRWKWLFFSIPLAVLISLPSCHPFGFVRHCMTYLNSEPGWISQETLQPSCIWDKWGFVFLISGAGPLSFLTNSHINFESMKKNTNENNKKLNLISDCNEKEPIHCNVELITVQQWQQSRLQSWELVRQHAGLFSSSGADFFKTPPLTKKKKPAFTCSIWTSFDILILLNEVFRLWLLSLVGSPLRWNQLHLWHVCSLESNSVIRQECKNKRTFHQSMSDPKCIRLLY